MTNITLSIEDSVYKKMKRYSEIKWNEFVRKCIKEQIERLQEIEQTINDDKIMFLGDEKLLAQDWLSEEDNKAWKDL